MIQKNGFEFNKRFWITLSASFILFLILIIIPFLFGYIDSTILGYGLSGILDSFILMVIVRLLNRADPLFRKRLGYVVLGIWLGFAVGSVFGIILFSHQIIAVIGSLGFFVCVVVVLPIAGGVVGYVVGKRKYAELGSLPEMPEK